MGKYMENMTAHEETQVHLLLQRRYIYEAIKFGKQYKE
jgi:hypothetical protein